MKLDPFPLKGFLVLPGPFQRFKMDKTALSVFAINLNRSLILLLGKPTLPDKKREPPSKSGHGKDHSGPHGSSNQKRKG
jgi:hypothetical protein